MSKAVRKAARGIVRDYGEVENLQVSRKGSMDFVTQSDLRSEKIIREELEHARPRFGFLMEESGEVIGQDADHRWVIDPIDGTSNFIHAIPYFCLAVSYEQRQPNGSWQPQAAVIYEPLRDELFLAEKGKGAFYNDRRMQVSARKILHESIISTHAPKFDQEGFPKALQLHQQVVSACKGIRTMGATALDMAYIASGRFDVGYYTFFKRWDVSAGLLLVEEAGGIVTELDGKSVSEKSRDILLGTPAIHSALLQKLQTK
jgi:myo-inositol-1(or 4)-monophosphatase